MHAHIPERDFRLEFPHDRSLGSMILMEHSIFSLCRPFTFILNDAQNVGDANVSGNIQGI